MTNYADINTYRMESNPDQVMADTLDLLKAGVDEKTIDACLMRSEWIENGYQMLQRISIREQEKREFEKFARENPDIYA